ncbi:23S rRNA (adenine(2503)-C(2))-methyltransferase RlmN [cyanobiont of Ornithocercus magnificus]|nr:23S rRNA (adenine(2503)-C(2))-methyltransferase RlmN [cyanobiont of Ornithocercus magnificus]
MVGKLVLLGLSQPELQEWAQTQGQPAFRGRQIYQWLYDKSVHSVSAITVLPKYWREAISIQGVNVGRLSKLHCTTAQDGTAKLLLATIDEDIIETVGIPTNQRLTVCVSSQVGCPMGCRFCATGKGGLQRSLEAHEIVSQVLSVREVMRRRPTHVVFMGMGEPLLNSKAVLAAIRCLNEDLGISQRRITVSTVGIPNALPQLAEMALSRLGRAQFTLAVSLHAPNQALREQLIPAARLYHYDDLLEDCRHYLSVTGRRVSFEYVLLDRINDLSHHAEELADRVGDFQSHVNLIPYNPIGEEIFRRPSPQRISIFRALLERRGITVTLRASRGLDQNAACGQLRHQQLDKPLST